MTQETVFDKYHVGRAIGTVDVLDAAEVEYLLSNAFALAPELRKVSAGKRADWLRKLGRALEADKELLTDLIIAEAGKPRTYAQAEVTRCLQTLEAGYREALHFGGEMVPMDFGASEGKTAFTKRFAAGVVLGIAPFNFPLNLALHKIVPAIATGCPILLKPSPQAPLSCEHFAKRCEDVGLPDFAVSVIPCDIAVAEQLVRDPRIAMLSFTGSAPVGWYLKSIAGRKKVALELGGNAAVIVDETANLPLAAKLIAQGAFLYAGQVCIATQRVYAVGQAVYDQLTMLVLQETRKLSVGDPNLAHTVVGPVIDRRHLERIADWVSEAQAQGAKILCGGHIADHAHHIYAPTWLTQTNANMKVNREEVFGPVGVIECADTFEQAVAAVNLSPYGLQAGVFTNKLDRLKLAHRDLEVGGVIMNNVPGFRVDHMPYGGIKESGLGREGIRYAMEEMTEPRLLVY